jgi:hypothetical protein
MEELQATEDKLNNHSRKFLGYRTPQEVFGGLSHQLFFEAVASGIYYKFSRYSIHD